MAALPLRFRVRLVPVSVAAFHFEFGEFGGVVYAGRDGGFSRQF